MAYSQAITAVKEQYMHTKNFTYTVNHTTFHARAYSVDGQFDHRPTLLIYHAFEGMNAVMADNAKHIVSLNLNAVTLDVYGDGVVLDSTEDCLNACMSLINDRPTLHQRLLASVTAATSQLSLSPNQLYAIGFCFGGLCVLDLARLGTDLAGVISVHGVLASPDLPQHAIKAKVLACHGYDDPQIPNEQIAQFMQEMNRANADWTFVTFGHTKHAFSDPQADKIGGPEMGREFNPQSTARMWQLVTDFCT